MTDIEVAEFLANTDARFIIGLLGAGFFFAWISEFFFSLCALFVEFVKKKIKGATKNNV